MTPRAPVVIHVTAADLDAAQRAVLERVAAREYLCVHYLFHVGGGRSPRVPGLRVQRVHAPCDWPVLGAGLLRRAVLARVPTDRPRIAHVWTPTAARWAVGLAEDVAAMLFEVSPSLDTRALRAWLRDVPLAAAAVACPLSAVRARLERLGVPRRQCLIVPPLVDVAGLAAADRAAARARCGVGEGDTAVLILPPIEPGGGAFYAAWAGMLVEKVRPDVRLLLPLGSPESDRIRRLVRACEHNRMFRFVAPELPLSELVAAADLAAFLAQGPVSPFGLATALAAGRALIATDNPAVRELRCDRGLVWWCRPRDPRDAARALLAALEVSPEARIVPDVVVASAREAFSPEAVESTYAAAYTELAEVR